MKRFLGKKQLMMVALVAALGVAVALNVYLTDGPSLTAGTGQSSEEDSREENLGDATFVGTGVSEPQKEESSSPSENVNYFDQARENRAAAREEALEIIQELLDNAQVSAEDKTAATLRATTIAEDVLRESNIENLILAKGFADCVVFIEEESCRVVVQSEALQQQESLQIMEIVLSQSAVPADRVQVMASKA